MRIANERWIFEHRVAPICLASQCIISTSITSREGRHSVLTTNEGGDLCSVRVSPDRAPPPTDCLLFCSVAKPLWTSVSVNVMRCPISADRCCFVPWLPRITERALCGAALALLRRFWRVDLLWGSRAAVPFWAGPRRYPPWTIGVSGAAAPQSSNYRSKPTGPCRR
jgi:hypothetical protein